MTPEPGDVVEVYILSEFRGIGIFGPRYVDERPTVPYKKFVRWLTGPNPNTYNYVSGDYGIGEEHTVNVIWRPE